jgi:hypothetical protein
MAPLLRAKGFEEKSQYVAPPPRHISQSASNFSDIQYKKFGTTNWLFYSKLAVYFRRVCLGVTKFLRKWYCSTFVVI